MPVIKIKYLRKSIYHESTAKKDGDPNWVSYRYSFSVKHGLHEDDFRNAFMAVLISAHASYDVVKQYAVGRFRRADREEIICKAQKLIIELDQ